MVQGEQCEECVGSLRGHGCGGVQGPPSPLALCMRVLIQAKFEAEAVGGSFDRVRDAVAEHSSWLQANCEAQRAYYRSFVEQRIEEARAQDRDMREVELALAGESGGGCCSWGWAAARTDGGLNATRTGPWGALGGGWCWCCGG